MSVSYRFLRLAIFVSGHIHRIKSLIKTLSQLPMIYCAKVQIITTKIVKIAFQFWLNIISIDCIIFVLFDLKDTHAYIVWYFSYLALHRYNMKWVRQLKFLIILEIYIGLNKRLRGIFDLQGSTLIPVCISNYTHYKVWAEITYPLPNFNDATFGVWE